MLTKNQIISMTKKCLPAELRGRLQVQAGVHGCNRGTVQAWLDGWPGDKYKIPARSFKTYCKTAGWGHGPYEVCPREIANHIIAVEEDKCHKK